jgi:hypothetical protein
MWLGVLLLTQGLMAAAQTAHLQVRTADGRTTYRLGEWIPLALDYTADVEEQFDMTTGAAERNGLLHESFQVQPKMGWADPLETYFGSVGGIGGSFLSGLAVLSAKPTTVPLDLNEWVRFDRLGVYSLTVTSHRVSQPSKGSPLGQGDVPLQSEPLKLRIVPASRDWQAATLAQALDALRANPPAANGMPLAKRTEAIAALQYLGTSGAIAAMAQHLRDDEPDMEFPCAFGLMGVSPRMAHVALATLEAQMARPEFPVSNWFLQVIPVLALRGEGEAGQAGQDAPGAQLEERTRLAGEVWSRIAELLATKQGRARSETALMLLDTASWVKLSGQRERDVASVVAESLAGLPADKQLSAMGGHWDLLQSPELLPLLKRLARVPLHSLPTGTTRYGDASELRASALHLWYRLDPAGAREEALRQISEDPAALKVAGLWFLPAEERPELEARLGQELRATEDFSREAQLLKLMLRFGTGSEVPLVRERLQQKMGDWACDPQDAALAYIIEFDPTTATPLLEQAMRQRGEGRSHCYQSMLQELARLVNDPLLTKAAITALDDENVQVTQDALIYLQGYGDASAKQPVWQRYLQWSEKWKGHGEELDARAAGSFAMEPEMGLGQALGQVLLAGQGWVADRDLIAQVKARCVGEQTCQQIEMQADRIPAEPYPVSINNFSGSLDIQVAQYGVKSLPLLDAKVVQYPRGTRFLLAGDGVNTEEQHGLEEKVRATFAKQGMVLTEEPQQTQAAH